MATDNTFGAAGTNMSQLPQGALGALGGSETLQTAYTLANIMTPKAQEFDPALAALLYFTEMGKQASQPGATLLGSVVGSGQAPAAYMMKQAEAAREREAGIGKTAVQLASVLAKDPAPTESYLLTADILPLGKKAGDIVRLDARGMAALPQADQNSLVDYKPPGAGTEKERYGQQVIELGPMVAAGTATDKQVQLYSIAYQNLIRGFTTTRMTEDGRELSVSVPGITLPSNLPAPEGVDVEKILNDKSREWGALGTNANYAQRMLLTEGVVREVLDQGYNLNALDVLGQDAPAAIGTLLQSPQGQRFYAASRNWIAAVLRKESGAAISDGEYLNGLKQYFPQVNDTPAVILDKEALRAGAIKGMYKESGDAFKSIYPGAMPFLQSKVGDETFDIINPRGYANQQNAEARQGRSLYIDSVIESADLELLGAMLGKPDFIARYTPAQQRKIKARIEEIKKAEAIQ
jgi:hypothetical protein